MKLLLDRLRSARGVRDENDRPPLPAPLKQALGGSGVKLDTVVNDAPDVAEDQAVALRKRVEDRHCGFKLS